VDVFVARQAIFDRSRKVWGYELLFRSGLAQECFDGTEESLATQQVISNSLLAIGLDNLLGGKKVFINFGREMLLRESASFLPKDKTVIEILENVQADSEVMAAIRGLRALGYRIALDDFTYSSSMEPLLGTAHLVKVEMATPRAQQVAMVRDYHARGLQMLAEKVETPEEFDWAREAGYDYFQGYFFARPTVIQGRQIPAVKMNCLRLLREAHQPDIDFDRLAKLISQDVSFSYKLLRYANSARFGRSTKIQSVRRALVVLGEEGIRRWVSIAAMPMVAQDKPGELITHSLVRARFMEVLGRSIDTEVAERAFLIGLFSLLDALLDLPLKEVLAELNLEPNVVAVLLDELQPHQSPLSALYKLVGRYEAGDWDEVNHLAKHAGIAPPLISQAYCEALPWVDDVLRS
jgi:c-di-GMP-related signal transduction protein